MIRVLVVDDSAVARELLVHVLEGDPEVRVVGTAADGEQALAAVARLEPDVVTMDVHLPGMDGYAAARRIMETRPVPIVIVTSVGDRADVRRTFRAAEAGAVAFLPTPPGPGHPDHPAAARELVETVKLMAEVKVVRRWPALPRRPDRAAGVRVGPGAELRVVALGASVGGPQVLNRILRGLGPGFPLPLLVVQHMAPGFLEGFADWLSESTGVPTRLARAGDLPLAGRAWLAPDGRHLELGADGRLALTEGPPEHGLRPSVSALFRSVARVAGPAAVGVLLTGMGRDGAAELLGMRRAGAVTLVQDRESAVVHGMAGEALAVGGAALELTPDEITAALQTLARGEPLETGLRPRGGSHD
ncbi:MAG: chemotaxis-specific protein-glutamate methyltransferase CheB [Deferrisomatales bacterium]